MALSVWEREADALIQSLVTKLDAMHARGLMDPEQHERIASMLWNLGRPQILQKLETGWRPKNGYLTDVSVPSVEEAEPLLRQAWSDWLKYRGQGGVETFPMGTRRGRPVDPYYSR